MATRLTPRKAERLERIHDVQDSMMSAEDYKRCNELKDSYNKHVKQYGGDPFLIEIPPGTSEVAYNCFLYATKRVGEKPIPMRETSVLKFRD
jgi:hypothetical protein